MDWSYPGYLMGTWQSPLLTGVLPDDFAGALPPYRLSICVQMGGCVRVFGCLAPQMAPHKGTDRNRACRSVVNGDDAAALRGNAEAEDLMAKIDTTVPVSARIWNYWMGGTDYFPVDKAAGDEYAAVFPGVFDLARASRGFIVRVVRYLAGEAGIRQFLDIGTGLPSHDNTHEIAHRVAPESRVVYVDNDPMVIVHARALLTSNPAREKLDFTQPVAIMLVGMLGHIGNPAEDDDAYTQSIVATLRAALPSGGYLALNEAVDADQDANKALDDYNQTGAVPYRVRRRDQIVRFFDGLELVDPGIVQLQGWRPEPSQPGPQEVPALGGVGRKR